MGASTSRVRVGGNPLVEASKQYRQYIEALFKGATLEHPEYPVHAMAEALVSFNPLHRGYITLEECLRRAQAAATVPPADQAQAMALARQWDAAVEEALRAPRPRREENQQCAWASAPYTNQIVALYTGANPAKPGYTVREMAEAYVNADTRPRSFTSLEETLRSKYEVDIANLDKLDESAFAESIDDLDSIHSLDSVDWAGTVVAPNQKAAIALAKEWDAAVQTALGTLSPEVRQEQNKKNPVVRLLASTGYGHGINVLTGLDRRLESEALRAVSTDTRNAGLKHWGTSRELVLQPEYDCDPPPCLYPLDYGRCLIGGETDDEYAKISWHSKIGYTEKVSKIVEGGKTIGIAKTPGSRVIVAVKMRDRVELRMARDLDSPKWVKSAELPYADKTAIAILGGRGQSNPPSCCAVKLDDGPILCYSIADMTLTPVGDPFPGFNPTLAGRAMCGIPASCPCRCGQPACMGDRLAVADCRPGGKLYIVALGGGLLHEYELDPAATPVSITVSDLRKELLILMSKSDRKTISTWWLEQAFNLIEMRVEVDADVDSIAAGVQPLFLASPQASNSLFLFGSATFKRYAL